MASKQIELLKQIEALKAEHHAARTKFGAGSAEELERLDNSFLDRIALLTEQLEDQD